LSKEKKSEVRRILTECEKIANWQLELETKLNQKSFLLGEQKQIPQLSFIGPLQIEAGANLSYNENQLGDGSTGIKLIETEAEIAKIKDKNKKQQDTIKKKNAQITELEEQLKEIDS